MLSSKKKSSIQWTMPKFLQTISTWFSSLTMTARDLPSNPSLNSLKTNAISRINWENSRGKWWDRRETLSESSKKSSVTNLYSPEYRSLHSTTSSKAWTKATEPNPVVPQYCLLIAIHYSNTAQTLSKPLSITCITPQECWNPHYRIMQEELWLTIKWVIYLPQSGLKPTKRQILLIIPANRVWPSW